MCQIICSFTIQIFIGDRYIKLNIQNNGWGGMYDSLTTHGVKLWNPLLVEWCEVSVQGNCFSIRDSPDRAGISLLAQPYSNELYEGSVIDIQGVLIYFQSPDMVKKRMMVSNVLLTGLHYACMTLRS